MSEQRTVVLSALESKSGTSNGRDWTKYSFKDANGDVYSTFDKAVLAVAEGKLGQRFTVTFETNDKGYKNLTAVEEASGTGGGEGPNWDEIGLRKTRCALWAAFLSGEAMAEIIRRGGDTPTTDMLIRIGTRLVAAAENDIFERVHLDDGIPFEVAE